MGAETNVIEYGRTKEETNLDVQTKVKKEREAEPNGKGELRFFGVRVLVTNLVPACEKIDKMFGSGGEAIVHYMRFETGQSLFDAMIKHNPSKSLEELLKALVDAQPSAGWGNLSIRIIRANPPMVDIVAKNPPVKTTEGSHKHLISSFWAGVLSRYFNRQMVCKNFSYNADKDEFSCTITI
jgi:predicted hydrocarbon binding protein